jgi:hypothetical protein
MANVKVESIKYHTTDGKEYPVGATYSVDESAVDNLAAQGMALRVDRAQVAKDQAAAAEKAAKARAKGSTAVAPMTTDSVGLTRKPGRPRTVKAPLALRAGPKK